MAFIYPLNILAIFGQLLLTVLIILYFRRKKRKKQKRILIYLPLILHSIFFLAILGFAALSFTQHEENDIEKISLGIRKYLVAKAGMEFLAPTPEELARMDKLQEEMKFKSLQESKAQKLQNDPTLQENTKVEILEQE